MKNKNINQNINQTFNIHDKVAEIKRRQKEKPKKVKDTYSKEKFYVIRYLILEAKCYGNFYKLKLENGHETIMDLKYFEDVLLTIDKECDVVETIEQYLKYNYVFREFENKVTRKILDEKHPKEFDEYLGEIDFKKLTIFKKKNRVE